MQKMSPIPTLPIALHIRAARIPIRWTVREHVLHEVRRADGSVLTKGGVERVFWPQVVGRGGEVQLTEIDDPLDCRIQLFKIFNTNMKEEAILNFLHRVGAWQVVQDNLRESWAEGTYAHFAYGHRQAVGLRVLPTTLDDLLRETKRWYKLLSIDNPTKLKAEFQQPPAASARVSDQLLFSLEAHLSNTLPVSLEWHGKDPYAVIETISAWELMIAAAWADVVSRAETQVCARCGTRFTWHRKKKHCQWECGHLAAVRKYKRKMALEERKQKEATTGKRPNPSR